MYENLSDYLWTMQDTARLQYFLRRLHFEGCISHEEYVSLFQKLGILELSLSPCDPDADRVRTSYPRAYFRIGRSMLIGAEFYKPDGPQVTGLDSADG